MTALTGAFSDLLKEGLYEVVALAFKQYPDEYKQIINVVPSKKNAEETTTIEGLGAAQVKTEGASVAYADLTQGYNKTHTNVTYAYGIRISREMYDDDLYNIMSQAAKHLGRSMKQRKEVSAANLYNNAFSASYTGGDAKALCATDHPYASGGTWTNRLAANADISTTSIESMLTLIEDTTDANSINIQLIPKTVLVPTEERFNTSVILESQKKSGTANNDKNVLLDLDLSYMVNHYFTDADAWFVKCDEIHANMWERMREKFENDDDFDTGDAKFKVTARHITGWSTGLGIAGTPGA